jgi:hypothetical protein
MGQEMGQESEAGNRSVILWAGGSVRVVDETVPEVISIHAVGCHPDTKRRGEATEAEFIARAAGYNFRIAKPWGDSDYYDVLVGMGSGFWRVQVKRAPHHGRGQYRARTEATRRTTSTSSRLMRFKTTFGTSFPSRRSRGEHPCISTRAAAVTPSTKNIAKPGAS